MGRTLIDLLRLNRQFAAGVILLGIVAAFACLSFFSPYAPNDSYVVPPDLPPSADYPLGTTSRGQDLFWLLSFAMRNTLLFGLTVAALSLRSREFTETGIFSGMSMRQILVEEHLPYVLPIVFSTTMNNINWSIGFEVTLSVLGFTDINTPTIGVLIYWANQHTALVAGIWWWIFFPVLLVVMTFVGLFLLAVSMNEYIDPRSRLGRSER